MKDPRHDRLSDLLVNYSCSLKPGEKVLIQATDVPVEMIESLIAAVYKAGAFPVVDMRFSRIERSIQIGATKESLEAICDSELHRMKNMDAFIGIRGPANTKELSDVPSALSQLYDTIVSEPVHSRVRVPHTKWVVLRYPTTHMAMMAKMSTEAFENYFFNVTADVNYKKMSAAMDKAVEFMKKIDRVEIKGKGTDISFSIKGIGIIKCDGHRNIPDGEIYTAPVRNSVNGVITYNTPSTNHAFTFENVKLTFKDGKIVDAVSNDTKRINEVLDVDEGARYIGEFALGCNPYINSAIDEILFDEKISGSFHFTPGNAYDAADNGNRSALHWDLVCIQTPEYGGGEIYMDGELIRKDGKFVHEAFLDLNPESLK
ncbi:MAG: aminopeptidase [Spirochaetes bacterium]|nr:aminopeptidase [Spirochaetota bacterium]